MASLQPKKVIAICQMTAKSDKKSNISTCLEMIKAAKVQNAEVSMLPSNNIICPCVKHSAVCDHSSHESLNFCEKLFCLLFEAVVAISLTGLFRNPLPFLCVPDSIKLDVYEICLKEINIHYHFSITLLSKRFHNWLDAPYTHTHARTHARTFARDLSPHLCKLYKLHTVMYSVLKLKVETDAG
jgi:hypothetical protein